MTRLTVIYESGILKPTEPLDLPEGQYLQIQILEQASNSTPLNQALEPLILSGSLTLPRPNSQNSLPESDLTFHNSDIEFSNLLSDSIIEDRG